MSLINTTIQPQVSADETVSGQLKKVMEADNPLVQQARTRAVEAANKRGLLNSSMAVQAGEQAALNVALPIASQDASTHAQRGAMNQQFQQQAGGGSYGTGLIGTNLQAQQTIQKDQQGYSQDNMRLQTDLQKGLAQLGNDLDLSRIDRQVFANTQGSYLQAVNELIRQTQISVGELQAAEGIPTADKSKMLADQGTLLKTHLTLYKDLYENASTWSQNWVSFPSYTT
jgi:hypothetical protein